MLLHSEPPVLGKSHTLCGLRLPGMQCQVSAKDFMWATTADHSIGGRGGSGAGTNALNDSPCVATVTVWPGGGRCIKRI
jgi:hypothetical protein